MQASPSRKTFAALYALMVIAGTIWLVTYASAVLTAYREFNYREASDLLNFSRDAVGGTTRILQLANCGGVILLSPLAFLNGWFSNSRLTMLSSAIGLAVLVSILGANLFGFGLFLFGLLAVTFVVSFGASLLLLLDIALSLKQNPPSKLGCGDELHQLRS